MCEKERGAEYQHRGGGAGGAQWADAAGSEYGEGGVRVSQEKGAGRGVSIAGGYLS